MSQGTNVYKPPVPATAASALREISTSAGTEVCTQVDGANTTALNGTASATALYLNWSGTAATIDASSNIDVTGTITIVGCFPGDD